MEAKLMGMFLMMLTGWINVQWSQDPHPGRSGQLHLEVSGLGGRSEY
jgi:hypothetical protein